MRRQPITSSVIQSIGYDPDSQTLEVEFHTGRIYRYFKVPPPAVKDLIEAASIGETFNRNIRNRYRYREITSPAEE